MNLDEINGENEPTRICLFGSPKAGKTKMVGKLAEHFKLHWFDFEQGWKTLLQLPQEHKKNVRIYRIPDSRVMPVGIDAALKLVKGGKTTICRKHGKVDAVGCQLCRKADLPIDDIDFTSFGPDDIVVWDSGSQIAQSAMNHRTKEQSDDYKPTWDDYMAQGFAMKRFLTQIQVATYNTVFITHETEVKMEDGATKLVPVSGTRDFSRDTAKYFDHVVYCRVVNKEHRAASSTIYSVGVLTGSRTDVEVENEDEPSLLRAFKPSLFIESDAKKKLEKLKELKNAK